jgi:hypothetical protein
MTEGPMDEGPLRAGSQLRTPRAAAVAGIVFSVLLISALVLLRLSVPTHPAIPGRWLTDSRRRAAVAIALNLVPFAGIAFLWFMGVVRDRIGGREDRFFATVFLGSGLLFVGMLFVAAAISGGLIAAATSGLSGRPAANTLALGRDVTAILLNVYTMRMAAVFHAHHRDHCAPHGDSVPMAHLCRPGDRAGAAGGHRHLSLGGIAFPGMDPGTERRYPRGQAASFHPGGRVICRLGRCQDRYHPERVTTSGDVRMSISESGGPRP